MGKIAIGRVVKARGLRGEIRVLSYFDSLSYFHELRHVYLEKGKSGETRFGVRQAREHGKCFLLLLEGCDSVAEAQQLVGAEVTVPPESFLALPEGSYYWHQMEGMDVYTQEGEHVGVIRDFLAASGNEVLVVSREDKQWLLPVVSEVIAEVDLERRVMTIHPIAGLLEDDD